MPNSEEGNKLQKYTEKFAALIITILIALIGVMYTDTKTRVTSLEDKVSFLYQDKVGRAEFREEMGQMRSHIEGTKSDIIQRLDFYFNNVIGKQDGSRK